VLQVVYFGAMSWHVAQAQPAMSNGVIWRPRAQVTVSGQFTSSEMTTTHGHP